MSLAARDDSPFSGLKTCLRRAGAAGFSFAEMLVAISLAAMVLIAAVLAFQAIGTFNSQRSDFVTVTPPAGVMTNFYGSAASTNISTWSAPSYGHLARVELLREKFYEDLQKSVAVYALPRTARSSLRTNSLPVNPAYAIGTFDYRRLSTPEAFRQFLTNSVPDQAGAFDEVNAFAAYTNGAVRARNLSVLMLRKSGSRTNLNLHCMYEVDFVSPASPGGIYASVRRYQGDVCTDYYDVFYPDRSETTSVNADYFYVAANFERSVRPATNASVANVAAGQPFYFIWWPDPASTALPLIPSPISYSNAMTNQTSLFFVVPMFPAL